MRRGPLLLLLVGVLCVLLGSCDTFDPDGVRFVWEHPAPGLFLAPTEPVVEDGRAFVAFNQQLSAFDAEDGELLWTAPLRLYGGPAELNLLTDENRVYVYHIDWVAAVSKEDGRVVWTRPLGNGGELGNRRMAQDATHLYLPRTNEVVRVRKDTGAIEGRFDIRPLVPEGISHFAADARLSPDGTTLYVATGYSIPDSSATDGFILALNPATGAQKWAFSVPNGTWTPPGGSPQPSDAGVYGLDVDDDVVVFPGGSTVYALDRRTGAVRWAKVLREDGFGAGATLAGDAVLVGSQQERIYCLDRATGEERWHREVRGSLIGPITVRSGRVYFDSSLFGEVWVLNLDDGAVVWTGEPTGDDFISPVGVGEDDDRMVVVGDQKIYGLSLP